MSFWEEFLEEDQEKEEDQDKKITPEIKPTPEEVELKDLHPPKKPTKTPPTKEIQSEQSEEFFIDWNYLANNSSFQRGFQEFMIYNFPFLKGISARESKKALDNKFRERSNQINEALTIHEVVKHDTALIREIQTNPLFLEQKSKHNS